MTRAEIHAQLAAVHAASDDPRERPILFSAPMVRAILADRKTQTRRIVKPPRCATVHGRQSFPDLCHYDPGLGAGGYLHWAYGGGDYPDGDVVKERVRCPYGATGDRLWVRETWAAARLAECHEYPEENYFDWYEEEDGPLEKGARGLTLHYRADGEDELPAEFSMPGGSEIRWRPSIHMPRWASRITLEVTAVRAERLREISEADAEAEGVEPDFGNAHTCAGRDYRRSFERLWDAINGKRAPWASNPWVWVVEFRRLP